MGFSVGSKDGLDIGLNVGTFVGDCVGDLVGLGALEGTVNNDGLDEGSVVGANERLSDGVVLSIRFFVGLSEGYEPHPELPFDFPFPFPLPQLQLKLGAFDDWVSLGLDEGVIGVLLEGLSGTIKGPVDGEKLG